MATIELSTTSNRAAAKLISVATKNIGANIAAYATFMASAKSDGLSINAMNKELAAMDYANVLPARATLGVYAQSVDHGDTLALNTPADYATVFSAIMRVRRVKGYDLSATFAPIAEMTELSDKRDAMRLVGTPDGLPIVGRDGSEETGTAAVAPESDDATPADSATDSDSLADDMVKSIARLANAFKGATFTPEEYARIAVAMNALGVAATKAKPAA